MSDFTPTTRTKLKRNYKRGAYDRETVYAILDAVPHCHVGYVIDGQPYVTPTLQWREGDRVYWHGSSASRMLRTVETGVPVCLTVSTLDGYVLARSAFHHSVNYRSVMIFGTAHALTGADEKEAALKVMMEQLFPGRWDALRPVTAQELKATTVVGMEIEEAAAKIRTGPPVDDEEDYGWDVWAGVLPTALTKGAPIDDPRLEDGVPVPENVTGFRRAE